VLARVRKWIRRIGITIGIVIATVLLVRSYDAWRSPPLKLWHTKVPHELDAEQIDAADWGVWMAAENSVFAEMQHDVIDALPEEDRIPINRYFGGSPINPLNFPQNWNHSYALMPEGKPRGAVVLVHGLTDSPYSMRHIALRYVEHGFVAVADAHARARHRARRLTTARGNPGWRRRDSACARRKLAGRQSATAPRRLFERRRAHAEIHARLAVGSGAGAARPPGAAVAHGRHHEFREVRGCARLAGGVSIVRQGGLARCAAGYNPFKYNSFPVNAARQSSQVVGALQDEFIRAARSGALAKLPPVLTFQSALDATVSTSAVVQSLYANLPANGSELVLFDINRRAGVGPMIKPSQANTLATMLPAAPRNFTVTVVGNAANDSSTMRLAL
jgi:alpha-beta hydrolase superfamily lysophospholipase